MDFLSLLLKSSEKMFKINNRAVQNKSKEENVGPEKVIVKRLIRIVQRRNLAGKQ